MVHALRQGADYNMYRKTYISKVIEELSAVARKLQALRNAGKQAEAMETLEHFYKSVFPNQGTAILEAAECIIRQTQLGIAVLAPLAEVLTEEAELLYVQGKPEEATKRGKKALTLLNYLDEADSHTFSLNRKSRIQLLEKK